VRAYEGEVGKTESEFERQILKCLTNSGYHVRTQWQVGYYRIDLVVEGGGKRLAIECDGDRYHPIEKLADDIARQTVLERLGWHFIRVRGSAFYRDADAAMKPVFDRLSEMEIPPDGGSKEDSSADWTLVNELEMLAREADEIIEDADTDTSSETQDIFPDEPTGVGLESAAFVQSDTIFQGTADATIERVLSELGGQSSIERFLRHFAKARGFQRLGKNIRKSLNRELNR
jgi:very-short-patch-repair endonuclease